MSKGVGEETAAGTKAAMGRQSASPVPPVARRRQPATTAALVALAALIAGTAVLYFVVGRPTTVKAVTIKTGSIASVVYATGAVEPVRWAKVVSLQRKRITWICNDCEDRAVTKGQELARLDDVEERAQLTELEARLKRIQDDAARIEVLVARNVTARTAYEEKLTQVREYEAKVAAQRDRVADLVLRSPMDGVVLRRDGEIGEIAGVGNADILFWIGERKPLRIVADVGEDDIPKVKEGQTALLRHDAAPNMRLEAKVASITPKGDPQSKTFRVYLSLPDDTPLKIGMSVEANIVVRDVNNALLLPADAVSNGMVQVIDAGRVSRRRIETGIAGTGGVEVKSGLAMGMLVVSPFSPTVNDGDRVRLLSAASP